MKELESLTHKRKAKKVVQPFPKSPQGFAVFPNADLENFEPINGWEDKPNPYERFIPFEREIRLRKQQR